MFSKLYFSMMALLVLNAHKEEKKEEAVAKDNRFSIIMSDDMGYSDLAPYRLKIFETFVMAKQAVVGAYP